MKVMKLNWISKAAREAEFIVGDGTHQCLVFSQPCSVRLNQILVEPLHALDVENLMIVIDQNKHESVVKLNESYFSQYCVAKVKSIEKSIVSIGNILIELEIGIPNWAKEGDLVEFKCARLDVW